MSLYCARRGAPLLALWGVALCVAGLFEAGCHYTAYELGASASVGCTVTSASAPGCASPPHMCLPASTVAALSPRWLGIVIAGMGGPLISWLPMLALAMRRERSTQQRLGALSQLQRTMLWYLGFIGVVRNTHVLTASSAWCTAARACSRPWDPSGHTFVYGAQLVPLALLLPPEGGINGWAFVWLNGWAYALWYLSMSTATFFHTLSETAAGYALSLLLALALRSDPAARGNGAVGLRLELYAAAAAPWAGFTAVGWWAGVGAGHAGTLAAQLVYDCALWGLAGWLHRQLGAGRLRGAQGSSLSALAGRASESSADSSS